MCWKIRHDEQDAALRRMAFEDQMFLVAPDLYQKYKEDTASEEDLEDAGVTWMVPQTAEEAEAFAERVRSSLANRPSARVAYDEDDPDAGWRSLSDAEIDLMQD